MPLEVVVVVAVVAIVVAIDDDEDGCCCWNWLVMDDEDDDDVFTVRCCWLYNGIAGGGWDADVVVSPTPPMVKRVDVDEGDVGPGLSDIVYFILNTKIYLFIFLIIDDSTQ